MKFFMFLLITLNSLFAIQNLQSFAGSSLSDKSSSQEEPVKMVYKDMLAFLENSQDPNQLLILGSIYVNGTTEQDSVGDTIKKDPFLAESFLLKAINKDNIKALSVLAGFYMFNEDMRKLDPKLQKAEKYLKEAYKKGDNEASTLLSTLYFEKEMPDKGLEMLFSASNKNDSNADMALAFIFKDGLIVKNKQIIKVDIPTAEFYLNKACSNKNKSEKINNLCFNSNYISIENRTK